MTSLSIFLVDLAKALLPNGRRLLPPPINYNLIVCCGSIKGENSPFFFSVVSVQVFTGNNDMYTVVRHSLKYPIITRYLRIKPKAWNGYIALRAEFYGCRQGEVSFDLPFPLLMFSKKPIFA